MAKRSNLSRYVGRKVKFKGSIESFRYSDPNRNLDDNIIDMSISYNQDITCEFSVPFHPLRYNALNTLLKNVFITAKNDSFENETCLRFDHLWLGFDLLHYRNYDIGSTFEGYGTVTKYQRKDGSIDVSVKDN